jgi:hypothetical protein
MFELQLFILNRSMSVFEQVIAWACLSCNAEQVSKSANCPSSYRLGMFELQREFSTIGQVHSIKLSLGYV